MAFYHLGFLAALAMYIFGLNPGPVKNSTFLWVRHKYGETDADPPNAARGFIFSHVGWIVMNRHSECIRGGRDIDMSDIIADPVVMFQKTFINPVKNVLILLLTSGEGSHNYHHTFPWDYKTSELPYMNFNTTTLFIDTMAKLGWTYNLREASPRRVEKVAHRIGHKSEVKQEG